MGIPMWIRPGVAVVINWGTVERVWVELVQGVQMLRVRHMSGAVDDYVLSGLSARRIVKWLSGWHWIQDLTEE